MQGMLFTNINNKMFFVIYKFLCFFIALNASKETPKRTTGICSEEGPSSAANKAKLTKSGNKLQKFHFFFNNILSGFEIY